MTVCCRWINSGIILVISHPVRMMETPEVTAGNDSLLGSFVNVLSRGVDHAIPGNGGPECVNFISMNQRWWESAFVLTFATLQTWWGYQHLHVPTKLFPRETVHTEVYRRLLLCTLALIFGIELGYKLASESLVYVMNPCHVTTVLQLILLLCNSSSRFACAIFRFQMYILAGTTLALAFPVLNTRLMAFEVTSYYVQHTLLLAVPAYLISIGGAYQPESFFDWSWAMFSMGLLFIYHFLPMQIIGVMLQVNLNNMVCPAISDPFRGRYWRVAAVFHQTFFVSVHGKIFSWGAENLSRMVESVIGTAAPLENCQENGINANGQTSQMCNGINSHLHDD